MEYRKLFSLRIFFSKYVADLTETIVAALGCYKRTIDLYT